MEQSFFNTSSADHSNIKFCVRLKSYLDVAGVPSEYYTDKKITKYQAPKVETDPLKKLLEPKDKFKIKVPPEDKKIDLVARLS